LGAGGRFACNLIGCEQINVRSQLIWDNWATEPMAF
jgi:hypothetical protein